MSDKSHALEMEFTEMKSRVTVCSFLAMVVRIKGFCKNVSLLAGLLSNMHAEKWQNGDYLRS